MLLRKKAEVLHLKKKYFYLEKIENQIRHNKFLFAQHQ